MFWWLFSGFFFWLGMREIYHHYVPRKGFARSKHISKKYVLVTFMIAMALAYTPLRDWQFERFLAEKAEILAETDNVSVNCKGVLSTAFGRGQFASGYVMWGTKRINLQHPVCDRLREYLQSPEKNTNEGVFAIQTFTHEAMHVRGEHDEAKTECQAIQRYVRAAKLLGVSSQTAKKEGMRYYTEVYPGTASRGMYSHYHSVECAPGKTLDEKLPDSTWN